VQNKSQKHQETTHVLCSAAERYSGMQSATQFLMHQEVQESATTPNTWNSLIASTEASKRKYQQ